MPPCDPLRTWLRCLVAMAEPISFAFSHTRSQNGISEPSLPLPPSGGSSDGSSFPFPSEGPLERKEEPLGLWLRYPSPPPPSPRPSRNSRLSSTTSNLERFCPSLSVHSLSRSLPSR